MRCVIIIGQPPDSIRVLGQITGPNILLLRHVIPISEHGDIAHQRHARLARIRVLRRDRQRGSVRGRMENVLAVAGNREDEQG